MYTVLSSRENTYSHLPVSLSLYANHLCSIFIYTFICLIFQVVIVGSPTNISVHRRIPMLKSQTSKANNCLLLGKWFWMKSLCDYAHFLGTILGPSELPIIDTGCPEILGELTLKTERFLSSSN